MELGTYQYTWLIIIGIVVFFMIRVAIGYYASRKVTTTVDYIVAGRRLPIYLAGASIMATWFAAETLMGASAEAYKYGFQGVVFDPFGAALCLFISGFFFIRFMRRARYLTIIDFFDRRYGRMMGFAASLVQLVTYFGWTAAQIVAGGAIAHSLLGWPLSIGMIFVATIVIAYTMMGGMWADTLLDFMQMFLTAGGITIIFFAVMNAVGGWDSFLANAGSIWTSNPFTLLPIEGEGYLGYTGGQGWMYWLGAWMAIGLGSIAAQDLMQRSMSSRNESVAVHATYMAGTLYLVFGVMSPLIGIAMFAMNPNILPENTEFLLVTAALEHLHPIVTALFIAALTSALMSTSDSSILAGASVVTENIIPYTGKKLSEKAQLRWTRVMVLVIGVISLMLGLYAETIYKLSVFAWTVILVGIFAPFALGMYWKKANQAGALAGFAGGFITWIIALLILLPSALEVNEGDMDIAQWDAAYMGSVPAFLVSLVLVVAVSLVTQKADKPKPITDVDGKFMSMSGRLGWLPLKDALFPKPVPEEAPEPELAPAD
jgi:solute:Na+ symporter, SSS family